MASRICKTPLDTRETLLKSYTGQQLWSGAEREKEFTVQLDEALQHCIEGELLALKGGQLSATVLGRIAAVKGLSVDTAIQMAVFARLNRDRAAEVTPLEVILCLSKTQDGERIHFNLSTDEYNSNKYLDLLKAVITKQPLSTRQHLGVILRMRSVEYDRAKRAKKALLMHEWTMGMPTRQIERCFNCLAGSVLGLAAEFSWLAEGFALVAKHCNWPPEEAERMMTLSEQMLYGVPKEGIEIAKARVRGLARGRAMLMVEHKLDTLEKIVEAPLAKLAKLLTQPVAERLIKRAGMILTYRAARKDEQTDGTALAKYTGAAPPDLKGWTDDYLPADDAGTAYLSGVRMQVDGRANKRRHLVLVNKHECWLSEGSFAALLRLCVAAKTSLLGWVPCDQLGSPDTYHQVACRLNQDLQFEKDGTEKLVTSNWSKQYRLSVPPKHIALNRKRILQHYPEAQDILVELDRAQKNVVKQAAG